MVLNRINLLIAGGNEGGEQGRQVPLEEEGALGAGKPLLPGPTSGAVPFPGLC